MREQNKQPEIVLDDAAGDDWKTETQYRLTRLTEPDIPVDEEISHLFYPNGFRQCEKR